MNWLEVSPLPDECQECPEEDCYNCDVAGHRWVLTKEDELRTRRKMLEKAVERLQRQIREIDKALEQLAQEAAESNKPMTQDIWEHCVGVCLEDGDFLHLRKLLHNNPKHIRAWKEKYEAELTAPNSALRKKEEARWTKLKHKLVEELGTDWVAEHCLDLECF